MPSIKEKCSAQVSDSGGWHTYRCSRNATIVEGGKPYCKIHSPSYLVAKQAKQTAQYEADRKHLRQEAHEATENRRKLELFPRLVAACALGLKLIEAAEEQGLLSATHYGVGMTRETLRAIIAEAKGQGE